ncbi:MAG: hypothetical protein ACE15E_22570 [Acidobacteriota bacterium]
MSVHIEASTVDLVQPTDLAINPGETKTVSMSGDNFVLGWVSVMAKEVVAASAVITTRAAVANGAVISQATAPAQPAVSKVVSPVFVRSGGSLPIDNTGVAIAVPQRSGFFAALLTEQGEVIATTTRGYPDASSNHYALFVTELFPDLPEEFTTGSHLIEFPEIPRVLAAGAFYARGGRFLDCRSDSD